jgi:hypothetical protein
MQATNGGIILTRTALTIFLMGVSSYMYYIGQKEADEKETEPKRVENAKKAAMKRDEEKERTIKK